VPSFFIVGNYGGGVVDLSWVNHVARSRWRDESSMKQLWMLVALVAGVAVLPSQGQAEIYRCGNEYTNNKPDARAKGCKLIEGGNVTVVQGASVPKASAAKSGTAPRVDASEQKARDSDRRQILQDELKKALARQDELQKEYNNGEPEKQGGEARNHQKYLDRVAELKASLARNENDINGIRREIDRLPSTP
jgi:hypothetical protein